MGTRMDNFFQLQRSDVQPSERLASLDIMGAQLRAPEPLEQYDSMVSKGLRRALNIPSLCRDALASRTTDVVFQAGIDINLT